MRNEPGGKRLGNAQCQKNWENNTSDCDNCADSICGTEDDRYDNRKQGAGQCGMISSEFYSFSDDCLCNACFDKHFAEPASKDDDCGRRAVACRPFWNIPVLISKISPLGSFQTVTPAIAPNPAQSTAIQKNPSIKFPPFIAYTANRRNEMINKIPITTSIFLPTFHNVYLFANTGMQLNNDYVYRLTKYVKNCEFI